MSGWNKWTWWPLENKGDDYKYSPHKRIQPMHLVSRTLSNSEPLEMSGASILVAKICIPLNRKAILKSKSQNIKWIISLYCPCCFSFLFEGLGYFNIAPKCLKVVHNLIDIISP
jgi:hypothetical protein